MKIVVNSSLVWNPFKQLYEDTEGNLRSEIRILFENYNQLHSQLHLILYTNDEATQFQGFHSFDCLDFMFSSIDLFDCISAWIDDTRPENDLNRLIASTNFNLPIKWDPVSSLP